MNKRTQLVKIILPIVNRQAILQPDCFKSYTKDVPWLKEHAFGVLRFYPALDIILDQFAQFKNRDLDIKLLLLLAFYQLHYNKKSSHFVVNETVKAVIDFRKPWATGLVNAILRRYCREFEKMLPSLERNPEFTYAHPEWLLERIQKHWPNDYEKILFTNNVKGPLSLRINTQKITVDEFCTNLEVADINYEAITECPTGINISPRPIESIPGFEDGHFAVQDGAGQRVAPLLSPKAGERILDACVAPGSKSLHLMDIEPKIKLHAIDINQKRLDLFRSNCKKMQHTLKIHLADASKTDDWWDNEPFDKILVDAPCSGIGVIRRHPDIKLHRSPENIQELVETQLKLLQALWPLLKPAGILLYSTCSILKEENDGVMEQFLEKNKDAQLLPITAQWGSPSTYGRTNLPGQDGLDGFYYARIAKS